MARARSPERDRAFELYKENNGNITLREIANQLGVPEKSVSGWKFKDKWDVKLNGVLQKIRSTPKDTKCPNEPAPDPFPGQCAAINHKNGLRCKNKAMDGSEYCRLHTDGRPGQCTAKSKQSGERCKKKAVPGKKVCRIHGGLSPGAPAGNQHNLKHGFFRKIFPDDEETLALVNDIMEKGPLDILWENIMIQYLAIARAQKIMFVQDKGELIEHLKREKRSSGPQSDGWEKEWEFQFAWDRQATLLNAQAKAMQSLERLIGKYEDLVEKYEKKGLVMEEHRLRLEKLQAEIDKIQGGGDTADLLDEALDEEGLGDE